MYQIHGKRPKKISHWALILLAVVIIGGGALGVKGWYDNVLRPVSSSHATVYFTVEQGQSVHEIAFNLKSAGLIRSSSAFETYVKTQPGSVILAGTYILSPSMSTKQIVQKLMKGDVAKNLLTILPGKRLDQIKKAFIKAGYGSAEVDAAFDPANYRGHPALAGLPSGASLEGFLYPDSFQKDANTPATTIVRESLDEMNKHLTADVKDGFAAHRLSIYQGVTLASIVEQETGDPVAQPHVAQVFLTRLAKGMRLQSNVTANYAADLAGIDRNINIQSPYNTYLVDGLPPGPISNMPASALKAVAHPAAGNYLFFFVGSDCQIHYTRTQAEHDSAITKYGLNCHQ